MKLSVIIPVFNERSTIREILRQVEAAPFDKEIIIVDDCSTDGTRDILAEFTREPIVVLLNERNRGKGFCLQRGFAAARGDIVLIQDADLEYYPDEYGDLIEKIVEGKADVVYGNRFAGAHRVFYFYHYLGNQALNLIANFLYNTTLTDLMTGYKAFRAEVIKSLPLRASGFGIEAEITARIFRRNLRVYEVPISYNGRDYEEGKKITYLDFFRSVYWLVRCWFETEKNVGAQTLDTMRAMRNYNQWLFAQVSPAMTGQVIEIGSGIGALSRLLIPQVEHVTLTDINEAYLNRLQDRFGSDPRVRIVRYDVASPASEEILPASADSVLCSNVLEHIKDDGQALRTMAALLKPEGKLALIVPAHQSLFGTLDRNLGHWRRYDKKELRDKLEQAGFAVDSLSYHNIFAVPGWFLNSRIFQAKKISALQSRLFDKMVPLFALLQRVVPPGAGISLVARARKRV